MIILTKKITVLLSAIPVILIAFISVSQAQKAEFGARLMPTISSLDMKSFDGGTIKGEATWGMGVGAFVGINPWEHAGIQGEVIYNSISQKYQSSGLDYKINMRYVNIPLLLSLNTGKTNPFNFNIVVGPQIGISAGSDIQTTGDNGNNSTTAVLSIKKGDIGLAYGAGFDFGINTAKTLRLGFGFRGVYGLVNISDKSQSANPDTYYILDKTNIETYSAYAGLSILF